MAGCGGFAGGRNQDVLWGTHQKQKNGPLLLCEASVGSRDRIRAPFDSVPPRQPRTSKARPSTEVAPTLGVPCGLFSGSGAKNLPCSASVSVCAHRAEHTFHPRPEQQRGKVRGGRYRGGKNSLVWACRHGMATPRRAAAVAAAALSRSSVGSPGSAGTGDEARPAGRKVT